MREHDRPAEERLSVFDRPRDDDDAVPRHFFDMPAHIAQRADESTVRLALRDGDRRIYVWRGKDGEEVFLRYANGMGGQITGGRRSEWTNRGASVAVNWSDHDGTVVLGLVSDAVSRVRVGDTDALLANNVYLAEAAFGSALVITTRSGEQTLPVPLVRRPSGD